MKKFGTLIVVIASVFFVTVASITAHENATGVVKERMVAMESIGKSMKQLAALIRGKIPYSPDVVTKNALIIKNHGGDNLTKLFPNGSIDKPSQARPDIWKNWDEFSALAKRLSETAGALANASNGERSQVKSSFAQLAKTCKTCHTSFRQKKEN